MYEVALPVKREGGRKKKIQREVKFKETKTDQGNPVDSADENLISKELRPSSCHFTANHWWMLRFSHDLNSFHTKTQTLPCHAAIRKKIFKGATLNPGLGIFFINMLFPQYITKINCLHLQKTAFWALYSSPAKTCSEKWRKQKTISLHISFFFW